MTQDHLRLPANYYAQQLDAVANQAAAVKKKGDAIAWGRLVTILALCFAAFMAFKHLDTFHFILSGLLLGLLLYILHKQSQLKELALRLELHTKLLNDELNALKGDHSAFYGGETYINATHPFSYDLDIFGSRSLYQVLNRTVTTHGADNLAASLQNPYGTKAEIAARQQAIQELAAQPEYMHQFRVTGMQLPEEQGADTRMQQWLKLDNLFAGNKLFAALLYIVPALSVLFIVLSVMQGTLHTGLIVMIAVNWGINIKYAKKVKLSHYLVGESVKMIAKTERLLYQVMQQSFTTPVLQKLQTDAAANIQSIAALKKLVHLFDNRQNGMVGPLLNSLFMFDVNCMTKLEKWRNHNKEQLDNAMQLVAAMDKYCSYANYVFNHPENIYPEIDETATGIQAQNLLHPLIHRETAVGNSFSIGKQEQLYMLTGANMTGKSTFIRTVGTNLILAYTGVSVPAVSFSVPLVKIYTSIRVTDSVQDDVSYFKAELQRMQQLMNEVGSSNTPYLILLDEPLRGTNSADKQAGTKAIVEKLLRFNAIGIIATHDTGLCSMADEHPGKISNYHFESDVTNGVLQFDYQLKPGGSTSNNATILMHMMGIVG